MEMINLRGIETWPQYQFDVLEFNKSSKETKWNCFKKSFLQLTNNRCPICETLVSNSMADIDHFRPQADALYPFLKYQHNNYLLMCISCNRVAKNATFPVLNNNRAINIATLCNEYPFLVNPRYDNIYFFFKLKFIQHCTGECVLELTPNDKSFPTLLSSLELNKAEKSIEIFGLSFDACKRINGRDTLLKNLFSIFYKVAEAKKDLNEKDFNDFMHRLENIELQNYGFFEFIKRGLFEICVP